MWVDQSTPSSSTAAGGHRWGLWIVALPLAGLCQVSLSFSDPSLRGCHCGLQSCALRVIRECRSTPMASAGRQRVPGCSPSSRAGLWPPGTGSLAPCQKPPSTVCVQPCWVMCGISESRSAFALGAQVGEGPMTALTRLRLDGHLGTWALFSMCESPPPLLRLTWKP